ncbi:MAG TPA: group 1 truncated hemoglobin [Actinocrinis sp.]|nr:group 1 truncated hemoglobin [Actinocrinis sp.]
MTTTIEEVEETPSAYQRVGGGPAVKAVVGRLYEELTADPELSRFFEGVELSKLRAHMAALLSQVLGGPADYTGRELGEAHAGLGITDADYDRVGAHLIAILGEFDVPGDIVAQVGQILESVRETIVEPAQAEGS